jgi:hypothetical protein
MSVGLVWVWFGRGRDEIRGEILITSRSKGVRERANRACRDVIGPRRRHPTCSKSPYAA